MLQLGYGLVGTPEEICEQLQPYVKAGIDQLGFGVPNDVSHEEALEMIETFGKYVIPEFDKDPVHLTDKYRAAAKPKYQMSARWFEGYSVELLKQRRADQRASCTVMRDHLFFRVITAADQRT